MLKIKAESGRCIWSKDETRNLLALMKEQKMMEQLDGKTRRNRNVYMHLAKELAKKGSSKSSEQIKLKFRTLKKDFFTIKRGNSKSGSGRQTMEYFNELNDLLGDRPVSATVGLDTTNVESMWEEVEVFPETEEFLDESFSTPECLNTSELTASSEQTTEKISKKRKSSIQSTLLEIATEIKETQRYVLETIREENRNLIEEERRHYEDHIKETKKIMEEERKATKEMLLEILKM